MLRKNSLNKPGSHKNIKKGTKKAEHAASGLTAWGWGCCLAGSPSEGPSPWKALVATKTSTNKALGGAQQSYPSYSAGTPAGSCSVGEEEGKYSLRHVSKAGALAYRLLDKPKPCGLEREQSELG